MSARRYRFTLIVCLVLLAVGLMPLIRFWPHLHWRYANAEIALGVEPIPSKPLSAEPPAEELALCRIGPISIELPKAMSVNHEFKEGMEVGTFSFRTATALPRSTCRAVRRFTYRIN